MSAEKYLNFWPALIHQDRDKEGKHVVKIRSLPQIRLPNLEEEVMASAVPEEKNQVSSWDLQDP